MFLDQYVLCNVFVKIGVDFTPICREKNYVCPQISKLFYISNPYPSPEPESYCSGCLSYLSQLLIFQEVADEIEVIDRFHTNLSTKITFSGMYKKLYKYHR